MQNIVLETNGQTTQTILHFSLILRLICQINEKYSPSSRGKDFLLYHLLDQLCSRKRQTLAELSNLTKFSRAHTHLYHHFVFHPFMFVHVPCTFPGPQPYFSL